MNVKEKINALRKQLRVFGETLDAIEKQVSEEPVADENYVEIRHFDTVENKNGGIHLNKSWYYVGTYTLTAHEYDSNVVWAVVKLASKSIPEEWRKQPTRYVHTEIDDMTYFYVKEQDMKPLLREVYNTRWVHKTKVMRDNGIVKVINY